MMPGCKSVPQSVRVDSLMAPSSAVGVPLEENLSLTAVFAALGVYVSSVEVHLGCVAVRRPRLHGHPVCLQLGPGPGHPAACGRSQPAVHKKTAPTAIIT